MTLLMDGPPAGGGDPRESPVDDRASAWLPDAAPEAAGVWSQLRAAVAADPPSMGLAAGDRPTADVEVLAGSLATCEYLLASRMHAASAAGSLPLPGPGAMLDARNWSRSASRRLARTGALAAQHPCIASAWSAGVITSEHVDPIARVADRFSRDELVAVVAELGPLWGALSPADVTRYLTAAERMLHPPPDPQPDEADAYESRSLSFSLTGDSVLMSAALPRVEGELVIAAIDALAERLRSEADHVPASARRADALVQLVNDAHATDVLPSRGGLPVSVSVSIERTALGDPLATTSRGHLLTQAETRWAACDAEITPLLIERVGVGCPSDAAGLDADPHCRPGQATVAADPAARLSALAAVLLGARMPLAVGRTQRTATPAQRRALAARDRGCVIPGCGVPAHACQVHHLVEWAEGGSTDLANLVTLCWSHHRQVDLHMWAIEHADPGHPPEEPDPGARPGTAWPANHAAPFRITRRPRHRWRS